MKNPYYNPFIFTQKHFKFTITPKSLRFLSENKKRPLIFSGLIS